MLSLQYKKRCLIYKMYCFDFSQIVHLKIHLQVYANKKNFVAEFHKIFLKFYDKYLYLPWQKGKVNSFLCMFQSNVSRTRKVPEWTGMMFQFVKFWEISLRLVTLHLLKLGPIESDGVNAPTNGWRFSLLCKFNELPLILT